MKLRKPRVSLERHHLTNVDRAPVIADIVNWIDRQR